MKNSKSLRPFLYFTVICLFIISSPITISPVFASQEESPFKFGVLLPLTGGQALYGADQAQAAQWAAEDINSKGGINGRKLQPIAIDTQGNPKLGLTMAKRLVSVDKVPVWLVGWSAVVAAVAPIANEEKLLSISVGSASPKISDLGEYQYTSYPLASVDVAALAKFTYNKLNHNKAAVMYVNDDTGIYAAKIYEYEFTKAGGKVVSIQAYDEATTDFTGPILQMAKNSPDVIHLHGHITSMPQIIAQMRQLGLKQQITSYSGAYNNKLLEQAGETAEGLIVCSVAPLQKMNPAIESYVNRWKTQKGREPYGLPYTEYFYDAVYILRDIFKWVDDHNLPITGENLRKALITIGSFETPLVGKIEIKDDHTVDKPVNLFKVVNGEFVYIDTID